MNASLSTVALLALTACSSNSTGVPGSVGPDGDGVATGADSPTSATGDAADAYGIGLDDLAFEFPD